MIEIGGINKVYSVVDCIMKKLRRFWIVYLVGFAADGREPHAPESKNRKINPCFAKFSIEH